MKKISMILMLALSVLMLTQCKKENLEDNNNASSGKKVKVRCEIPMGNGNKSDFTNLMTDGSIKWSTGTERIYLAVDGDNPQIVELTAFTTVQATVLAFEGEVDENLLEEDHDYQVWYFGNSMNLDNPYVTKTKENNVITKINGSIATQSGNIGDLGYHHIAMTTVTAFKESDGSISLPLHGILQNQIAIAYMDLTGITKLSGDAIIGTEYALECNNGEYELSVTPSSDPVINVSGNTEPTKSFVVLLPNTKNGAKIISNANKAYIFKDGISANRVYYRYISDAESGTLTWQEYEEPEDPYTGHGYVDLGLPSGLKWATCNVGATAPEDYGNYYAWGETEPKDYYYNTVTDGMTTSELRSAGIIDENNNLTSAYDAATANWGGRWRLPTKKEMQELVDKCMWQKTTQNSVYGYKVTGSNGNSIFLPAAGRRIWWDLLDAGTKGDYWSSTPNGSSTYYAFDLHFEWSWNIYEVNDDDRSYGLSVRPVAE